MSDSMILTILSHSQLFLSSEFLFTAMKSSQLLLSRLKRWSLLSKRSDPSLLETRNIKKCGELISLEMAI
ncbi:hypothetical protein Bca4012_073488 [Brassica carinata]